MKTQGIMRRARRRILVLVSTTLIVPVVFAQAPAPDTNKGSDAELDVTMRVIVDPDAKVPDEIVHRIPLPKPQSSTDGTAPKSDKPKDAKEAGDKGKGNSAQSQAQGRAFGQQTAEQARQRADEAKRNKEKPPKTPGPPGSPPGQPPGPPPPRGPG